MTEVAFFDPHAAALGGHARAEVRADRQPKPVDRAKLVETLTNICGAAAGKALLVDDDELVRRSVRLALEPIGWQVTEAENGQIAVEAITAARPDVIILDLMMPKMDGFESSTNCGT